jgi:uncharacterized protein YhfF
MNGQLQALERFAFGDSAEMADALLALVLAGRKTATCGAMADYDRDGAPLPRPGQRSIVLDDRGRPACIIETTDVACRRFDAVDSSFAREEGEGDLSLANWRESHKSYFGRNGGFAPDMMLVCEKFRLVERLDRDRTP